MNLKCLPLLLILAATVTACQKDAPSPAAAPADAGATVGAGETEAIEASDPAPEVVWDESAAPVAGTRIEIKPDPVSFCDAARQTVEVEWDVSAAEPKHLQLWIEDENGNRKLWVETKTLAGTKRSGNWVTADTRFTALDAHGKRVLTSVAVQSTPCS